MPSCSGITRKRALVASSGCSYHRSAHGLVSVHVVEVGRVRQGRRLSEDPSETKWPAVPR